MPQVDDSAAFAPGDWGLLGATAAMWGSSFLLIEIGLDHMEPGLVAALRLAFGAATLAAFAGARRSVPRADWPAIALLGAVWMAAPFLLFPFAQESIDSSLAGMINGAVPLFTAAVATLVLRRLPGRIQLAGLGVGFLGVVAVTYPAAAGAGGSGLGAALVLLATLLYGIAVNLAVPLQRRHGALPVLLRAQLVALVLVAPIGIASAPGSSFHAPSLLAVAALGALGTGLAFVAFTTLVGRVGATRGTVTIYFIPVVAVVLGVLLRDESVAALSALGAVLVLLGAYLTSRGDPRAGATVAQPGIGPTTVAPQSSGATSRRRSVTSQR